MLFNQVLYKACLANKFFEEEGILSHRINQGHCYHWAYVLHFVSGKPIFFSPTHAAILSDGKWYDANETLGCDRFTMWANHKPRKVKDLDFYQSYWNKNGRYGWDKDLCQRILGRFLNENIQYQTR